jgi:hypothetical protein
MKKWKWLHKWFSVVLGFFLLLWAVSGIILNHRDWFSGLSVNRNYLPAEYNYSNWNNASVRSAITLADGRVLMYGNVGIWITDTAFSSFEIFTEGIKNGFDNSRCMRIVQSHNGHVFAGTQSGLYALDKADNKWISIDLGIDDNRISDLHIKDGLPVVLTRSELFFATKDVSLPEFRQQKIPPAMNDDGKTGLFKTLWVIHSGEIYGFAGKLIVDFFALLLIFLVLSGYVYFFFPGWIKSRKKVQKPAGNLVSINRFSIKWHNKLGIWLGWFLLITTLTGMFLRPPLLIPIAHLRVGKIPFSSLDDPNLWHDRLRALHWNEEQNSWLIASNDGLYMSAEDFDLPLMPFRSQPPLSVMGINVLEYKGNGNYLIGSFNGLFLWNAGNGYQVDYLTGEIPERRGGAGSPIGKHLIAGYITLNEKELIFDYNQGLLNGHLPMPEKLSSVPMPLWNLALEVHTTRIFQFLTGPFYILIIPLFGLGSILILISGILVWLRRGKKNRKHE